MAVGPLRDGQEESTVLPVLPPRFALIELGLFALVILAEWLVPAFPDLTRYNPHAYWIPVLLLSLQYGTVSGLLAALLATAGTVLIGLPEPEIGESYFSHLIRAWTQPVLWLVVAMLLGGFRMRQIETKADLARRTAEMAAHAQALATHTARLEARCDHLERRLVTAPRPEADRLLEGLAALDTAEAPTELTAALARILAIALPDGRATVLVPDGRQFQVAHTIGGPEPRLGAPSLALDADDPLVHALAERSSGLSVMRSADERLLAGRAVGAVPLHHPATGALAGVLTIDAVAPAALDGRFLDRLQAIAVHLGPALARMSTSTAPALNAAEHAAPLGRGAPGESASARKDAEGDTVVRRFKAAALPLIRRWRMGAGTAAPATSPAPDAASRTATTTTAPAHAPMDDGSTPKAPAEQMS